MTSQLKKESFSEKSVNIFKKEKPQKQKGHLKEFFSKLSKGLMLPIIILPVAGLFNAVGAIIIAATSNSETGQLFAGIFTGIGGVVFSMLPLLFAIAVAITFSKDSGVAALACALGWLVFCVFQYSLIITNKTSTGEVAYWQFLWYTYNGTDDKILFGSIFGSNVGIKSLNTSVFGGICVGLLSAYIFNHFKNLQLPGVIAFFGGTRSVAIITMVAVVPVSLLFCAVWPLFGLGLFYMGQVLSAAPWGTNSLVYTYFNRALVPFGLHHVLNATVWFSGAGGTFNLDARAVVLFNGQYCEIAEIGGTVIGDGTWKQVIAFFNSDSTYLLSDSISGDMNIWQMLNTELAGFPVQLININGGAVVAENQKLTFGMLNCLTETFIGSGKYVAGCNPGQYMSGHFPYLMFGIPMIALAIIFAAPKHNRKEVAQFMIPAGFVCFLTAVGEPIEFSFLFLAPWLFWGFHALFAGISGMITTILSAHIGISTGGFIDFALSGIVPDLMGKGANSYWALAVAGLMAPLYFTTFYFFIKKFNVPTPGRENNGAKIESVISLKSGSKEVSSIEIKSHEIIRALGGVENIISCDACFSRLRLHVNDTGIVDDKRLKELCAKGVVKTSKHTLHVIMGLNADVYKTHINDIVSHELKNPKLVDKIMNEKPTPIKVAAPVVPAAPVKTVTIVKTVAPVKVVKAPAKKAVAKKPKHKNEKVISIIKKTATKKTEKVISTKKPKAKKAPAKKSKKAKGK